MPATVSVSSGLTGSLTSLQSAQATAASKLRPSVTVAQGVTETISYAVDSSTTDLIWTWVGPNMGTIVPSIDGSPISYTPQFPEGSDMYGSTGGRRQFVLVPAGGARTLSLAITGGTGGSTVYPLLFKKPASGPVDTHLYNGQSREAQNIDCRVLENDIIAAFPGKEPLVFNWARSSQNAAWNASVAPAAAALYAGCVSYVTFGSVLGNDENSYHPYTPDQKAGLDASLASMYSAYAGFIPAPGNTSYRIRSALPDHSQGSAPYNDAVGHPAIAAYAPDYYNATYLRAWVDEYEAIRSARGALTDDRHGAAIQTRALWVATHHKRVYDGSWAGVVPQVEKRVLEAEAAATVKATAMVAYTEAAYMMPELAASAGKTALQARVDAVRPVAMFYEAVRLIDVADASKTEGDKTTAKTALDAAVTAGYTGGTDPNTYLYQNGRITAIVTASHDQIIKLAFGSNTGIAGFNRSSIVALGVVFANLKDINGVDTGISLTLTNAPTGVNTQTGLVSAVADVPDAALTATWSDTSNQIGADLDGMPAGRLWDIAFMSSRVSGTPSATRITVNGSVIGDMQNDNNVSQTVLASGVAPNGAGKTTLLASKGTVDDTGSTSSFTYLTVMIMKRRTA